MLGFVSGEFSMKHVNVIGHQGHHFHITIVLYALEFSIGIRHHEQGVQTPNHKLCDPCACTNFSCLLYNRCTNTLLQYANDPGGLCYKWHHQYILFIPCGGLIGFALLLLLAFLIFLSLPCKNFLKDIVLGALLDVLVLWKALNIDIELLGSILLVLGSTALVDLQVSDRKPHCCGMEGALACNILKHSLVTLSYDFGNQGPLLCRTHEPQGNTIHRLCPLAILP